MRMTVPSKTWIRSRLPSTTFTETRTVSPGAISGTSVAELLALELRDDVHVGRPRYRGLSGRLWMAGFGCVPAAAGAHTRTRPRERPRRREYSSGRDDAARPLLGAARPPRRRSRSVRSVGGQRGVVEQVRAARRAFAAATRGAASVPPRRGSPTAGWRVRRRPPKRLGPGVLRVLEQAGRERVTELRRLLDDAGDEPRDGVDDAPVRAARRRSGRSRRCSPRGRQWSRTRSSIPS